jgi:plastocyanin
MKTKVIVLLLVLSAVLLSGCLGNEQPTPEKNATPNETGTPEKSATPVETVTPEGNQTPAETVTSEGNETAGENVTPEGNVTPAAGEVFTPGIKGTPYLIRLANYKASPSSLNIKKGETVAWMNLQENPKRNFKLVSEEGLFENATLVYKRSFTYTFNETGGYNFTVAGQPKMNVSVSVAAP